MSDYCNPSKAFDFLDYDFIASAVVFYLFTPHYSPFFDFFCFSCHAVIFHCNCQYVNMLHYDRKHLE